MSDLIETVMNILAGNREYIGYAELDVKFFNEMDKLHLSPADEDMALGAWIAVTDHVLENRRQLTDAESKLMDAIFERIAMRHGYLRIVGR